MAELLKRAITKPSVLPFDRQRNVGVVDTSCLINTSDQVDKLVRINTTEGTMIKYPVLFIPESVRDEGKKYHRGASESEVLRNIRQLTSLNLARLVDVEELKQPGSELELELEHVLPNLSRLTVKDCLLGYVDDNESQFFSMLADAAMLAWVPSRKQRSCSLRRAVLRTVNSMLTLYEACVEHQDTASFSSPQKRTLRAMEGLANLIGDSYESTLERARSTINAGTRVYVGEAVLQEKDNSYVCRTRPFYKMFAKRLLRRLLFQGIEERVRNPNKISGPPRPRIEYSMRQHYRERFQPASRTDLEVVSAFAWPFEELDRQVAKRLSKQHKLAVISADNDISQLLILRKNYAEVNLARSQTYQQAAGK